MTEISPYGSFVLFECPAPIHREGVLLECDLLLASYYKKRRGAEYPRVDHVAQYYSDQEPVDGWSAFFIYSATERVSWGDFYNVEHQLIAFVWREGLLALHISDPRLKEHVRTRFPTSLPPWAWIEGVSALTKKVFEEKFLSAEQIKGLWLHGIHRSTPIKADNKYLSGSEIEYALNPFEDSTYTVGAIRRATARGMIGASPNRSFVWTRKSQGFGDFIALAEGVFGELRTSAAVRPLPFIARRAASDLPRNALEISFDLERLRPDIEDNRIFDVLERSINVLADYRVEVVATQHNCGSTADFDVIAIDAAGIACAGYFVQVLANPNGEGVRIDHFPLPFYASGDAAGSALSLCLAHSEIVSIWYESGHSVVINQLFCSTPLNVKFENWRDFKISPTYNVSREKPGNETSTANPGLIGLEDDLFSWVALEYHKASIRNGDEIWVYCDDGPDEISDFVSIRRSPSGRSTITLIPVKKSKTKSGDREIAVGDFQEVVSQAVKNIRESHGKSLYDRLKRRARTHFSTYPGKPRVWKNGQLQSNISFFTLLREISADCEFEVLILCPRVTRSRWESGRGDDAERLHRQQLSTLLVGAEVTMRALGVRLYVAREDI